MTLNCIIIDDEPLAGQLLANYTERIPFLNLIGCYSSAVAAIKDIKQNHIDVIYLDIQMPELSGLEFAPLLPETCKVVFTTAFSQYAIDSYKVNAADYLLKPISFEDFLNSAKKVHDMLSSNAIEDVGDHRFIFVKSDYKLVKVPYDEIMYIEGLKDYVKIYLQGSLRPIHSLLNMKKLEEILPNPEFMRIHRSYIVNMTKVRVVDHMRIVFGENFLPISESYKEAVVNYLEKHTLN